MPAPRNVLIALATRAISLRDSDGLGLRLVRESEAQLFLACHLSSPPSPSYRRLGWDVNLHGPAFDLRGVRTERLTRVGPVHRVIPPVIPAGRAVLRGSRRTAHSDHRQTSRWGSGATTYAGRHHRRSHSRSSCSPVALACGLAVQAPETVAFLECRPLSVAATLESALVQVVGSDVYAGIAPAVSTDSVQARCSHRFLPSTGRSRTWQGACRALPPSPWRLSLPVVV